MKASAGFEVTDAAMSVEDIAAVLGVPKRTVWLLYKSAMRKIRRYPHSIRKLRELVEEREHEREMGMVDREHIIRWGGPDDPNYV